MHRHCDVTNEIEGLPCICTYKYWSRRRRTTTTIACETHLGQEIHSLPTRPMHAQWSNWLTSCVWLKFGFILLFKTHTQKLYIRQLSPVILRRPTRQHWRVFFGISEHAKATACDVWWFGWLEQPNDVESQSAKNFTREASSYVVGQLFIILRTMLAI